MLPESPGRREEGFNKSAMRNKIAAYRSKALLKDRKFYRFGEVSVCLVRMSAFGKSGHSLFTASFCINSQFS